LFCVDFLLDSIYYLLGHKYVLDKSGNWRWRRVATNGRIVGASSEGYMSRNDCEDNARRHGYKR